MVDKPRMVLRVGFAGNRELPDKPLAKQKIEQVLHVIRDWLAARQKSIPQADTLYRYYDSEQKPLLRVVTGLAEGADELMAQCVGALAADVASPVETELAGVIPFAKDDYQASRNEDYRKTFQDRYDSCSYVLELDGEYLEGDAGKRARSHGYRSQGQFLLRHSDLLIAVADSEGEEKPGGTLNTVRSAHALGMPTLFLDAKTGDINPINTDSADLPWEMLKPVDQQDWEASLKTWLARIIGDPDEGAKSVDPNTNAETLSRLEEFFGGESLPRDTRRSKMWDRFARRFKKGGEKPPDDLPVISYEAFRQRAQDLTYRYIGLYRGAVLLNYSLAVIAVTLAAITLVLLGLPKDEKGDLPAFLQYLVLFVTVVKLGIVAGIAWNTWRANKLQWNDKAIDFRYLVERLRVQYYLPRVGSFSPPASAAPQFASRAVKRSQVDWLFNAIVRHVSPAKVLGECGAKPDCDHPSCRLDPQQAMIDIRSNWIKGQIIYHQNNAKTMNAMNEFFERWSKVLAYAVILVVLFDLLLLLNHEFEWHVGVFDWLHHGASYFVAFTAVLPAAVASLNGLRVQSECHRLVDRSSVMQRLLRVRLAEAKGNTFSAIEALHFAERTAQDMVEEVTEWSVIYDKELLEQ